MSPADVLAAGKLAARLRSEQISAVARGGRVYWRMRGSSAAPRPLTEEQTRKLLAGADPLAVVGLD